MFTYETESVTDRRRLTDWSLQLESVVDIRALVSRFGLAVSVRLVSRRASGSIPLRLSFLFKQVVVCGHCLVTLSLTINEAFR